MMKTLLVSILLATTTQAGVISYRHPDGRTAYMEEFIQNAHNQEPVRSNYHMLHDTVAKTLTIDEWTINSLPTPIETEGVPIWSFDPTVIDFSTNHRVRHEFTDDADIVHELTVVARTQSLVFAFDHRDPPPWREIKLNPLGHDVQFWRFNSLSFSVIPEPASVLLLMVGLGFLQRIRNERNRF